MSYIIASSWAAIKLYSKLHSFIEQTFRATTLDRMVFERDLVQRDWNAMLILPLKNFHKLKERFQISETVF